MSRNTKMPWRLLMKLPIQKAKKTYLTNQTRAIACKLKEKRCHQWEKVSIRALLLSGLCVTSSESHLISDGGWTSSSTRHSVPYHSSHIKIEEAYSCESIIYLPFPISSLISISLNIFNFPLQTTNICTACWIHTICHDRRSSCRNNGRLQPWRIC